jgi:hypothetical protein
LFTSEAGASGAPEDALQFLNANPEDFIPLMCGQDSFLLNKAGIIWVQLAGAGADEIAAVSRIGRLVPVRLTLAGGISVVGTLSIVMPPDRARVLDYMNARYVFGNCRFKDFAKVSPSGSGVEVSENPTPLPKWFSVIKARPSFSMEADFSLADRRHLSYGRECCILDDRKTGNYFPRNVSEIIRTPQRVELLAEGRGKSLLVSSETDYPGWKVRVEGREKPMERVNHVFRGVVLMSNASSSVCGYFRRRPSHPLRAATNWRVRHRF